MQWSIVDELLYRQGIAGPKISDILLEIKDRTGCVARSIELEIEQDEHGKDIFFCKFNYHPKR